MHTQAYEFVLHTAQESVINEPILEIGSRIINGSVRNIFTGCQYVGFDIADGDGVDVVVDITKTRAKEHIGKYQTIICTEVLEHVTPETLVPAMFDYLNGHCRIIITCATGNREPHSAVDGGALQDGEYYRNVDPDELHKLMLKNNGKFKCSFYAQYSNETNTDLYINASFYEKEVVSS